MCAPPVFCQSAYGLQSPYLLETSDVVQETAEWTFDDPPIKGKRLSVQVSGLGVR